MILTNITLTDFGVFRGQQVIQLAPRGRRPIILFGGKNGAGKSTLLEAIRLGLYGSGAVGSRISKDDYLKYLANRIHSNPNCLIQPAHASVAVEFQYSDTDGLHTYAVKRSWERRTANRLVDEDLQVERDGTPLDEIAAEHWQDFVRDLIPPGVSQLFFFDGEKIQQLAEDTTDQETLAEAIKSLLGLDLTERLKVDLGIYLSRVAKPAHNKQYSHEVDALQREITSTKQKLEDAARVRERQEAKLTELRLAISRVEEKIASQGGSFARNREALIQQQANLKARISQLEDSIRELCAGRLPFALVPSLCNELRERLFQEDRAVQAEAGRALLGSAKLEIVNRIQNDEFWAGLTDTSHRVRTKIQNRLIRALQEPLSMEQGEPLKAVHELSASERLQLLSWIDQALNDVPKTMHEIAAELERLYRELHRVVEALRKIPADEVLKPLLEELHSLHQKLSEAGKLALIKDEESKSLELKLQGLQRRYNQAAEKLAAQTTHGARVRIVPRVQKVLDEYEAALIDKKVIQLQGAVTECFNTLCRKKDTLRRITVNPKDFSVTLFDKQNRSIPKSQLSAGEKQVYAISMLWALAKTSGRPLPVIIDTPLARLDSDHRTLLVDHYFPQASHQVLILSTDTEVDQSYFSKLRPVVGHSYRLEFDPVESSTTIRAGYFWGGTE
jgi:DNA sulfur modification protein DndD